MSMCVCVSVYTCLCVSTFTWKCMPVLDCSNIHFLDYEKIKECANNISPKVNILEFSWQRGFEYPNHFTF